MAPPWEHGPVWDAFILSFFPSLFLSLFFSFLLFRFRFLDFLFPLLLIYFFTTLTAAETLPFDGVRPRARNPLFYLGLFARSKLARDSAKSDMAPPVRLDADEMYGMRDADLRIREREGGGEG